MHIRDQDIVRFLSEAGIISRKDLEIARSKAEKFGQHIDAILVHDGLLDEVDMRKMRGKLLGIKFVDLSTETISYDTLSLIPEPVARRHHMIPFASDEDHVHIALLDIESLHTAQSLLRDKKISPYFTDEKSLNRGLRTYQTHLKNMFGKTIQKEAGLLKDFAPNTLEAHQVAAHPSVFAVVETLLKHAIVARVSDIHIDLRGEDLVVRYRIDGRLYDAMMLPGYVFQSIGIKLKTLAHLDPNESAVAQDGKFSMEYSGEHISCRVTTHPTVAGGKIVVKLVRTGAAGFSLEGLGFLPDDVNTIHDVLTQKKGLTLVGGEKQSGVTTCLYTLLDVLNDGSQSIATVENPVEFQLKGVSQMPVQEKTGASYASGIKTLIKNDADIIMVGEMKDDSTLKSVIHASDLHKTVVAGVSGKNAIHIAHDFAKDAEYSAEHVDHLSLIIASRLLRTLSRDKVAYTLSQEDVKELKKRADLEKVMDHMVADGVLQSPVQDFTEIQFYKNKHPAEHGGYTGVYEVVVCTRTFKNALVEARTPHELEKIVFKDSAMNFFEKGLYKAVMGIVSLDEVLGSES